MERHNILVEEKDASGIANPGGQDPVPFQSPENSKNDPNKLLRIDTFGSDDSAQTEEAEIDLNSVSVLFKVTQLIYSFDHVVETSASR